MPRQGAVAANHRDGNPFASTACLEYRLHMFTGQWKSGLVFRWRWGLAAGLIAVFSGAAHGQALRYDYRRDMTSGAMKYRDDRVYQGEAGDRQVRKEPPQYATLRVGPFYSTATFTQSAGYRYIRTRGTGTDFLYGSHRGRYLKDGSDFPLISTLDLRNYVLITENMDLDLSVSATYAQYPMNTQEDEFYVNFVEEGFFGTLSWAFDITPFLGATIFDRFTYRTDFVDTRGLEDKYGGTKYQYIDNEVGTFLEWRLAKGKSVVGSFSREDFLPSDKEFSNQERITYREGVEYRQTIFSSLSVGARAAYSQTKYTAVARNSWNQEDYSVFADFGEGRGIGDDSGLGVKMSPFTRIRVGVGYSAGYSGRAGVASGSSGDSTAEQLDKSGSLTGFASLTTDLRKDLTHTFDYRRGLRTGFESDYELFSMYGYRIDWRGALESASFFTRVMEVEPSGDNVGSYRDWTTGLNATYALFRIADRMGAFYSPLLRAVDLIGTSTYTVRSNEGVAANGDAEPELHEDYATWASRLGTSFAVTKSIGFLVYFEHVERMSEAEQLAYTRDIFEAILTYRHQF